MSSPPDRKSFLPAMSSLSPWSSRSTTPNPRQAKEQDGINLAPQKSFQTPCVVDHAVSRTHRLSQRSYPQDCPPLNVHWFHAVDVPVRKPNPLRPAGDSAPTPDNPPQRARKYVPFSFGDSRAIEAAYQTFAAGEGAHDRERLLRRSGNDLSREVRGGPTTENRTMHDEDNRGLAKVPVNEDYLFDVDVEKRELMPAYWLGPVYNVRRGSWFFSDHTPCDENLATQLEEGFLKVKPWKLPNARHQRSASQPRSDSNSDTAADTSKPISSPVTPKSSTEDLRERYDKDVLMDDKELLQGLDASPQRTVRLFGNHMNSVVTYQDAKTAYLVDDDFLSKMSSTLYERFGSGGYLGGRRVTRGFVGSNNRPDSRNSRLSNSTTQGSPRRGRSHEREESRSRGTENEEKEPQEKKSPIPAASETRRWTLEREMSSLIDSGKLNDPAQQEEEVRRRDEREIKDDYKEQDGDQQGREIEHLLLVTHGIGQRLGLRLESVNFVHDVNSLRKTMKSVYSESDDLQALNGEIDKELKNCRIQVLPICWRHLLDFPKQSLKHNRREHDLGDLDLNDEDYPNLDDITVEGVPAVRNLITDLALDILLYQSPAYKGHITRIVLEECNRIYRLWKQRNPNFKGKVSLVGHSLGSAVMFDILCHQPIDKRGRSRKAHKEDRRMQLDFAVEDFYALGSPIGLFQMLKGRTIAASHSPNVKLAQTPFGPADDPFLGPASTTTPPPPPSEPSYVEITTSSPKCQQLFNIFHPTDPIAYRLEPLISPAMAALKPQPLPYTKRGIFTAAVGQGFSGIGARVTKGVSSLWTSLLSRGRGPAADEPAGPLGQQQQPQPQPSHPPLPRAELAAAATAAQDALVPGDQGLHPPTLIDGELETLFAGFQKRRRRRGSGSGSGSGSRLGEPDADPDAAAHRADWRELEAQARRLKMEEGKVRALNANGRVDYSIQEGAFDISLLASIASHLSYWADEDVSHFIISQLLARHRVFKSSQVPSPQLRPRQQE